MPRAEWNGVVIAEAPASECQKVEGNWYFPPASLKMEYFTPTSHTSVCGWKGLCNYYTVTVNGQANENAAWVYKDPKPAAAEIKNHVAFWKGVKVSN